jgi:hypothetical protein
MEKIVSTLFFVESLDDSTEYLISFLTLLLDSFKDAASVLINMLLLRLFLRRKGRVHNSHRQQMFQDLVQPEWKTR